MLPIKIGPAFAIPCRRRTVTSWPISALWVFLSVSLAGLSTFSFLQADWVIKRDLLVSTLYRRTSSNEGSVPTSGSTAAEATEVQNRSYVTSAQQAELPFRVDISNQDFSKFLSKYTNIEFENETIFYDSGFNRISKVTKVITTVRFGLVGVCTSPTNDFLQCHLYENLEQDEFPVSQIWPMLTLVGGSGCVTLCVCSVLSLLAVSLPTSRMRHEVAQTIGHAQTAAVVLLIVSLVGFPIGFTSGFVRHHCGPSANVYSPGDCEIGWAYALVLVSTSLSLYCPILVKFTAEAQYEVLPKYI